MTATVKAQKVDLRKAQEKVEDSAKALREYSHKAALVYLGIWGIAYDNGRTWWNDGKKFVEKAEKRGLKMEREINDFVKERREEATGEVRKVRERIEHRVETISKEVTSRGEAIEKEVQKAIDKVKPGGANGKSAEVGPITIQVQVTDEPPLAGYDEMNVDEVAARIETMDGEMLAKVRAYEATHKNRVTVLREIDAALEKRAAAIAGEALLPPIDGYDDMNVDEVVSKLPEMDDKLLTRVRLYEATHKNRVTIIREIDDLFAARAQATTEAVAG